MSELFIPGFLLLGSIFFLYVSAKAFVPKYAALATVAVALVVTALGFAVGAVWLMRFMLATVIALALLSGSVSAYAEIRSFAKKPAPKPVAGPIYELLGPPLMSALTLMFAISLYVGKMPF
ncbi:hypothetical protein ACUH9X_08295 [Dermabacteraceae bacterium P13147]